MQTDKSNPNDAGAISNRTYDMNNVLKDILNNTTNNRSLLSNKKALSKRNQVKKKKFI